MKQPKSRSLPRRCLSCGAPPKHSPPGPDQGDDEPFHYVACSGSCGREGTWGVTEEDARRLWDLSNEPVDEAKDRARRDASKARRK